MQSATGAATSQAAAGLFASFGSLDTLCSNIEACVKPCTQYTQAFVMPIDVVLAQSAVWVSAAVCTSGAPSAVVSATAYSVHCHV